MPDIIRISWPDESNSNGARGVYAFAVETVSQHRTIFASCEHGLGARTSFSIGIETKDGQIHGGDENINPRRYTIPIPDLDLVFWCIDKPTNKASLSFETNRLREKSGLKCLKPDWIVDEFKMRRLPVKAARDPASGKYLVFNNSGGKEAIARGMDLRYQVIDASVNSGSSGGPIWNHSGKIVGMVCGGSNKLSSNLTAQNGHLIYLPIKAILKFLQKLRPGLL